MRFILKKDPSCAWRFVRFAKNVWGLDGEDENVLALAGIEALETFFKNAGIPESLGKLNIDDKYFEEMAANITGRKSLENAFVPLNSKDIVSILKSCL